jgi:hypothetical protein
MIADQKAARALATRVAKESSNVTVRFGETNGRICLHLRLRKSKDPSTASETIYSVEEWNLHPWNNANRPRKTNNEKVDEAADHHDLLEAIANKESA